jgi:hypothetical protein
VLLVGGVWRRLEDWNLAAGYHQKLKGRFQASCESRKRLVVVGRRINCAGIAWLRRGAIRKDCTRAKVERATQEEFMDAP